MKFLYVINIFNVIAFNIIFLFGSFLSDSLFDSKFFDYFFAIMAGTVLSSMMLEKFKLYLEGTINTASIFLATLVLIINIIAIKINAGLFFFSMFPVYLFSAIGSYLAGKITDMQSIISLQRFNRARALFSILLMVFFYNISVFTEAWTIIIFAINISRLIFLLFLDMRSERIWSERKLRKDNGRKTQESKSQTEKEEDLLYLNSLYSNRSYLRYSLSNLLYANVLSLVSIGVGFTFMPFLLLGSFLSLGLIVLIPLFLLPALLLVWLFSRILKNQAGILTYILFIMILLLMIGMFNGVFLLFLLMLVLMYLIMPEYFHNIFDRYLKYRDFKE